MLRLVLAPAVALLAIGTVVPATAGWNNWCVEVTIGEELDLPLPEAVPNIPRGACVPLPVDPPPPSAY